LTPGTGQFRGCHQSGKTGTDDDNFGLFHSPKDSRYRLTNKTSRQSILGLARFPIIQLVEDMVIQTAYIIEPFFIFKIFKIHKNDLPILLREAVNELKLVEQGKLKARPAQELLDEL